MAPRRHPGGTEAALGRHWGGTRAALRRHWGDTRAALGRHNCQDHNFRLNFQFISIHFIQDDDTWHPLHCSVTYNGLKGCLVASVLGFRFHYEFRPSNQLTIRMQLISTTWRFCGPITSVPAAASRWLYRSAQLRSTKKDAAGSASVGRLSLQVWELGRL